ncbi:MAG: DNA polymerase IV [bacterium]
MKWFAHIDMDAFFASVELASKPYFAKFPFAVGGSEKSRTVVSAASYKAREYGIKAGMSMFEAYRKCPSLISVEPDMDKYVSISKEIFSIVERIAGNVDIYSVDEGFFHAESMDDAVMMAQEIKKEIKKNLKITCSAGIAKNRLVAKMASGEMKPDGLTLVKDAYSYIGEKRVEDVVGIGRQTTKHLNALGIYYVRQLRDYPMNILKRHFNSYGFILREISYGRDSVNMMWNLEDEIKSVGNTHTMEKDTMDRQTLLSLLSILSEHVSFRMKHHNVEGNVATLTVRYADFHTFTKQKKIQKHISSAEEIGKYSRIIFDTIKFAMPVRLLGISISNLRPIGKQMKLEFSSDSKPAISNAIDEIREKYGEWAIMKCRSLEIKDRNVKGRRMTE